jgi:enamine deaminase RidA (YjgF/YER057c/UK114 family)
LTTSAAPAVLQIALGSPTGTLIEPGLPVLAGPAMEHLFGPASPAGRAGCLSLFRHNGWLLGGATLPIADGLEVTARRLYRDLFAAVQGMHLARIWNYVPAINGTGPGGLENYRIFSRARSLAFEEHFGPGFKQLLPAASAVGTHTPTLALAFAASSHAPRHIENPLQVAAYDYPAEYGPRPPSFARATVVSGHAGRTAFISGTAAIRGHATVAPHQLEPQLTCTLANLRRISEASGLGPDLARGTRAHRHFKVYLRHAADQSAVATTLQRELVTPADQVTYLQADICREPLVVEIEATLVGV